MDATQLVAGWTAGQYWCERYCDVCDDSYTVVCAHQYGLLLALAAAYGATTVEAMLAEGRATAHALADALEDALARLEVSL
jgi:hypothetical protein